MVQCSLSDFITPNIHVSARAVDRAAASPYYAQSSAAALHNPATRARDEAIMRVGAANEEWCATALQAVLLVARRRVVFTTDDVWACLSAVNAAPSDNRALGAVMREAAKRGYITNTGRTAKSKSVVNHARPLAVWESIVYGVGA